VKIERESNTRDTWAPPSQINLHQHTWSYQSRKEAESVHKCTAS